MQFNTYIYILCFLPITVVLYYIMNHFSYLWGKIVLVVSSVIFYAYFDWLMLVVLGISILINYLFVVLIKKKHSKFAFIMPIIINIGLLVYYKYFGFIISNCNSFFTLNISINEIIAPLGISFFTFQQISYIVETYKGELHNNCLLDYVIFVLYFPKILMGPLIGPKDFLIQINESQNKRVNWNNVACGLKMFSLGLFKKVMIADVFTCAVSWGFDNINVATSMDCILVMIFYSFEIYFDFSGYSDMAVGSSLMFNIVLPINFDSPYKALSIRDFWKRWHISLTGFFTKYIYIPLGGSHNGILITGINTMVVFLISGIWHGANWTFILWGVLHGLLNVFERLTDKFRAVIPKTLRWILSFSFVNVLWLLFRSESVNQWVEILIKIFKFDDLTISQSIVNLFVIPETDFICSITGLKWIFGDISVFMLMIYVLLAFLVCLFSKNNYGQMKKQSWVMMIVSAIAFIWGVICLGNESIFVYFNF